MPVNFWTAVVASCCFGVHRDSFAVGAGTFLALFTVCVTIEQARDAIVHAIKNRS